MKNFLKKPWTWGTYLIMCAIGLLLSGLYSVIVLRKVRKW